MALDGVGVKVLALSTFFMGSQAGSFTKPASTPVSLEENAFKGQLQCGEQNVTTRGTRQV